MKTLGLNWNVTHDYFYMTHAGVPNKTAVTIRQFLSEIAKIFVAVGWLPPKTILVKIITQKIWQDNTDSNEAISPLSLSPCHVFIGHPQIC